MHDEIKFTARVNALLLSKLFLLSDIYTERNTLIRVRRRSHMFLQAAFNPILSHFRVSCASICRRCFFICVFLPVFVFSEQVQQGSFGVFEVCVIQFFVLQVSNGFVAFFCSFEYFSAGCFLYDCSQTFLCPVEFFFAARL